ncbi:MAG: glycosyltransferase family 1 protein, partial [Actinomycetota bacterium]
KDLPGRVAAFDLVADRDDGVRLVIAGPDGWGGPGFDDALGRARHRDRIERTGWVDDDRRASLLRDATVLAYPSRYEGFGLPPLEAMAVGTPVVATDAGALPEVLGDAADLVPVGDVEALAAALGRVLDDDRHRAASAARGLERVRGYSWAACIDGIVDLYGRA